MSSSPSNRPTLRRLLIAGSVVLLAAVVLLVTKRMVEVRNDSPHATGPAIGRTSADCRACHAEIFRTWAGSDHAHAHRPVDAALDAAAFGAPREFTLHDVGYHMSLANGKATLRETRPGAAPQDYVAEFVLGYRPLRQYVVPVGGGRYQMTELAFDPAKNEWFNVFGAERREPGEWGHWTGRGMNWNSMCAHCHLTDFAKNYDAATDTYASTWTEHGVGCVQCHGDLADDHAKPGYKTPPALAQQTLDRTRNQQTCAPCHARNELLTGAPRAGMNYDDHFRVALPVDPAVFYPDGQVRDEDFNWTSLLTSRMGGKAGVTCLDCHEPHSGKTRLPAADNSLCLQCHSAGNAPARKAPAIDPLTHSHHSPNNAGNQCVSCHMPTTTYMQRDPRHDHGFLKPDPLLTKELGIPNACDRCHADKGIDWQIAAANKWYGAKLDSRQRQRARVVDAAQKGTSDAPARLLDLLASEDVPAWKATLLLLARSWSADPSVANAAARAQSDPNALVRSAAVQVLASNGETREQVRPALRDPTRLVRVDAEWALAAELAEGSPESRELEDYLRVMSDQPIGQMRLGQDLAARGQSREAEAALRKAVSWDTHSAGLHEALGLFLDETSRSSEAAGELWRAAQLDARNASLAFEAALAFAGAQKLSDAELALRETVRRDATLDRAWYNLGLLLAQTNRGAEAVTALERAEKLAPRVADYPFARATILWNRGDREAARAAARRALAIDPNHADARRLLGER